MISHAPFLTEFARIITENLPDGFPVKKCYTEIADIKDDVNFLAVIVNNGASEIVTGNFTYRLNITLQMRLSLSDYSSDFMKQCEYTLSEIVDDTLVQMQSYPDGEGYYILHLQPEMLATSADKVGYVWTYNIMAVVQF